MKENDFSHLHSDELLEFAAPDCRNDYRPLSVNPTSTISIICVSNTHTGPPQFPEGLLSLTEAAYGRGWHPLYLQFQESAGVLEWNPCGYRGTPVLT